MKKRQAYKKIVLPDRTLYGWDALRSYVFERDHFTCKSCKQVFEPEQLIGDHIEPIALGGKQWAPENIQTLCMQCDKQKTAFDQTRIARRRRIERLQRFNKLLEGEDADSGFGAQESDEGDCFEHQRTEEGD